MFSNAIAAKAVIHFLCGKLFSATMLIREVLTLIFRPVLPQTYVYIYIYVCIYIIFAMKPATVLVPIDEP